MKNTIDNLNVNYTQEGNLYKKDFAKLCAIETLKYITSIIHGEFPLDISHLELKENSDNCKITMILKPTNESLISDLHVNFAFRRTAQITAYGYIATRFEKYQFSDWIDKNDFASDSLENSILFDPNDDQKDWLLTLSVPPIRNKNEFKTFTSYQLIPQLKAYMNDVFKIYRKVLIDLGMHLSKQDVAEMSINDVEKEIIKPYLYDDNLVNSSTNDSNIYLSAKDSDNEVFGF